MDENYEIGYRGRGMRPEERPPVTRELPERLTHLRDPEPDAEFVLHGTMTGRLLPRLPSDDEALRPAPALVPSWTHGVPPLRPAARRGERRPTRGGRHYPDIFLAEDPDFAGDIDVHFGNDSNETVVALRAADFLALQAAVTDPARPVTGRQAAEFLRALLASDGPTRDGWDPADAAAMHRVLKLLGEE
jgi:hypothetical protein